MVRQCCVVGCQNNNERMRDRRYVFRFPSDQAQCQLWLKNIPNEVQLKLDSTGVCSRHWPTSAKFTIIRKVRRPVDPPTIFINKSSKPLEPKFKRKNDRKAIKGVNPPPKKLETIRKKSAPSSLEAKKKGPYTLRKVKMKHYDLMMKGIGDEGLDTNFSYEQVSSHVKNETATSVTPTTSSWNEPDEEVDDIEGSNPSRHERQAAIMVSRSLDLGDDESNDEEMSNEIPKKRYKSYVVPGMFSPTQVDFVISPPTSDEEASNNLPNQRLNQRNFINRILTKALACHYCHTMFAFEQDLMEHRKKSKCRSSGERRLACHECQVEFSRRSELERHVVKHTSWGMTHLCLICRQQISWKNLHDHLVQHRISQKVMDS